MKNSYTCQAAALYETPTHASLDVDTEDSNWVMMTMCEEGHFNHVMFKNKDTVRLIVNQLSEWLNRGS